MHNMSVHKIKFLTSSLVCKIIDSSPYKFPASDTSCWLKNIQLMLISAHCEVITDARMTEIFVAQYGDTKKMAIQ